MGWFGLGEKKGPLDQIEIPADQLPPEVEKPLTNVGKNVENAAKNQGKYILCLTPILHLPSDMGNMVAMSANFEQLAGSMKDFSNMVGELKRGNGEWEAALTTMNSREKTLQEKYKCDVEDRKLQIEQLKAQALREETDRMKQKLQKEHELAMKKAQYEDQLRQKRKEADLQREIAAQKRIEEAKRGKYAPLQFEIKFHVSYFGK